MISSRKWCPDSRAQAEALTGEIVAAYYAEQHDDARNLTYPNLRVKLVDGNQAYLVSLRLGTDPAQMAGRWRLQSAC